MQGLVDRGRGPAVLLVHGQPGLGSDWDLVRERIEDDHRVLSVDRPGYGASGQAAVSMTRNAEMLAGLLTSRRTGPATIVGHSYGGGIALLLAARHPKQVRAVVLVSSIGCSDSVTAFDKVLATPGVGDALAAAGLFALGYLLPQLRRHASRFPGDSARWVTTSLPDHRYAAMIGGIGGATWRAFQVEQRALVDEVAGLSDAVRSIAVPAAVVTGTWDVVVPPSEAARLAAGIKGAGLVLVARTGHFVPRDAPGAVAGAIRHVEAKASTVS